jgi:hypothetical protein
MEAMPVLLTRQREVNSNRCHWKKPLTILPNSAIHENGFAKNGKTLRAIPKAACLRSTQVHSAV